jgi:ribosomal protein S18 acetylase RimI-like enzyme
MLDIHITDDTFSIKNISKDSIGNITSIYKNTYDFKFATGIFHPVSNSRFSREISEFIKRENVFFLDICLIPSMEVIGIVKGLVVSTDKIAWINSLVIGKPYQKNGYGRKVMKLLEQYLKLVFKMDKVYLSVHKVNEGGINFWQKCGYEKCDYLSEIYSDKTNEFVYFMWKTL